MLSKLQGPNSNFLNQSFQGLTGVKGLEAMEEISEEDSFADDIESVKGDIEQTERSSGAEDA